jgi:hypothetical protein
MAADASNSGFSREIGERDPYCFRARTKRLNLTAPKKCAVRKAIPREADVR